EDSVTHDNGRSVGVDRPAAVARNAVPDENTGILKSGVVGVYPLPAVVRHHRIQQDHLRERPCQAAVAYPAAIVACELAGGEKNRPGVRSPIPHPAVTEGVDTMPVHPIALK